MRPPGFRKGESRSALHQGNLMNAAECSSVGQVLAHARALGVARLDAQLLLAHRLGRSRAWLLTHDEALLAAADAQATAVLLAQRAAGCPLAYLVGVREFHGLALRVTPDVLVPRPDTETLVDWALELLEGPLRDIQAPCVVDLGTGSGAIALAVKQGCARARVHASDASAAALAVARGNGERLRLAVAWHQGHWWQAMTTAEVPGVDLALANPPYVAAGDPHLAELVHEPRSALVAEGDRGDGLADIERVVADSPRRLRAGGWLLLEHGCDQAAAVRGLLARAGFEAIATRSDLSGRARVSGGSLPHGRD